jgi:hypothetical protein
MWLDLAELKLIRDALVMRVQDPPVGETAEERAARIKLRDYFEEQVERVQKVADRWEQRKAEETEEDEDA